jgi:protein-L-isoaspartate(D-aspartate) O-methyltransferase
MAKFEDSYLHQGKRKALIETLRNKGINDERVLTAMMKVPRHFFFANTFELHAYDDKAFPIAAGQTISQPYTVAFQTQLLAIKPFEKVLEIGTGSGYQACVLAACEARVFSIERQKALFDITKPFVAEIGFGEIKCFYGDGYAGLPSYAPFDKIIITAAAPTVPGALLNQLKVGGWLVIPVGEEVTTMKKITRLTEVDFQEEQFSEFRFVPMLGGKAK